VYRYELWLMDIKQLSEINSARIMLKNINIKTLLISFTDKMATGNLSDPKQTSRL